MHANNRNTFFAVAALALFFFAFLGSEFFFDASIGALIEASEVIVAQGLILGASVAGFITFAFARRLGRTLGRTLAIAGTIVAVSCLGAIAAVGSAAEMQAAGCTLFFWLGIAGGAAHWICATELAHSRHLTRCIGAAYAAGLLLQFGANALPGSEVASVVVLGGACTALLACLWLAWPRTDSNSEALCMSDTPCTQHDEQEGKLEPGRRATPTPETNRRAVQEHPSPLASGNEPGTRSNATRTAAKFALTVACMVFLFSTLDNIVTLADAQGQLDAETWPRLFLAASGLAAGFVFDLREHRLMGPVMFCATLLSALSILCIEMGESPVAGLVVFYLTAGFFVVFFTAGFFMLAPRTKNPRLWASMGRIVNNACALAFVKPSLALVQSEGIALVMTAVIVLFAITSLLFSSLGLMQGTFGNLRLSGQAAEHQTAEQAKAASVTPNGKQARAAFLDDSASAQSERIDAFTCNFDLTPRETEVLENVLTSEKTLQQIADDMGMSLRMLQRHLSAIYAKTNTKTRAGLTNCFFSMPTESGKAGEPHQ